jgi:hypothetical protein
MLRGLWALFTLSTYTAAIGWIIISKIVEKITKKEHSFNFEVAIFVVLFIVSAIVFLNWFR